MLRSIRHVLVVALATFPLVLSCGSDGGNAGSGFGTCCTQDSQCSSGICDRAHFHCSIRCSADGDCPDADRPIGQGSGDGKCDDGLCESDYYQDLCEGGSSGSGGSGGSTGSGGSVGGSAGVSGSSSGGSSGGPAVDCTFPNEASICGCGSACASDGLCRSCGSRGSGCVVDEIYCCSDSQCPAGTQCTTLSSSPSGYHICIDLDPCSSSDDCFLDEVCRLGYCRDDL